MPCARFERKSPAPAFRGLDVRTQSGGVPDDGRHASEVFAMRSGYSSRGWRRDFRRVGHPMPRLPVGAAGASDPVEEGGGRFISGGRSSRSWFLVPSRVVRVLPVMALPELGHLVHSGLRWAWCAGRSTRTGSPRPAILNLEPAIRSGGELPGYGGSGLCKLKRGRNGLSVGAVDGPDPIPGRWGGGGRRSGCQTGAASLGSMASAQMRYPAGLRCREIRHDSRGASRRR